ncbi:MAG: hypothetical protein WCL00_02780 [Bacteroidota bacterium]
MAEKEVSGSKDRKGNGPDHGSNIFQRLIADLFPTAEERYERNRRKKRKRSPIREYFKQLQARRNYNKFQKREERRRKKHSKAMRVEEGKKKEKTNPFLQFFKKNFTRESRPYYYYAETDQPKSEVQRQRKRLMHFSMNSVVLYLITYFIAYFTYQAVVMFVASRFGLNSIFYFYEVAFPAGNNSSLWSSFNIILITFSGPFISLLLGLYYLLLKARKEEIKGLEKLFYLWLAYHSLNFFLGAFSAGVITKNGLGYVIGWTYMPTVLKFSLSIVFLFGMGLVGFFNSNIFLESSNSIFWTQPQQRPVLVLFGGLLPWAFSVIFLFVLKYPPVIPQHENIIQYEAIMYVTMVFFIAPIFVNMTAKPNFDITSRKAKGRRINIVYIVILVIILVAFRAGLDTGFSYFVFK